MFGSDLLVAPVLWEGFIGRQVYLPPGDWYDYWTGRHYAGNSTFWMAADLDSIPLFVRGGGFIFRQPVVQNTGEMSGKPLRVLMAPGAESKSELYEDDGESLQYRQGDFLRRNFHQITNDRSAVVEISAPEGKYRPTSRDLVLEKWSEREPRTVTLQSGQGAGEELPRLNASASRGWSFANGMVTIKIPDPFAAMRFTIQY
jgi:alpha-glucosidase (family GH31 glycosyl hydrolase)